jgi:hypothetical protein
MTERQGWRGKGDKVLRRSPRKGGKTCGRPFTAPRKGTQAPSNQKKRSGTKDKEDSEVQVLTESEVQTIVNLTKAVEDKADSEVQEVTETENERDITARQETVMFEIEQDTNKTPESDKTESTPDIFRSPVMEEPIQATFKAVTYKGMSYKGVTRVEETEDQDKASDSEDDIPVATLLRHEKDNELSLEQIQDCKEGPVGERAIGVTVAKTFDGVEYRGKIDSFRKARQRYYYHVTYSDGDEEELNQSELRDGFVLGLSDVIEARWKKYKSQTADLNEDGKSEEEGSEDEGSQYDNTDFNAEVRQKRKDRDRKTKRITKKKRMELSDVILPESGDKTVAAEAFHKLDANQKQLVAHKVNRQTKKVTAFKSFLS